MLATVLLLAGIGLVAMALLERHVCRLPLSAALIYLGVGWAAASVAGARAAIDPIAQAPLLELLTEWAVLVSLFAVGLRLGVPAAEPRAWRIATVLASVGMLLTIALAALAAHWLLGLAWPAALLVAAILAPTDPVLASEVQVQTERDRDAVRMSLTAEGGMNDGTAWPVVILALGALGLGELGPGLRDWLLYDLLWLIGGGALLGWAIGRTIARALRSQLQVGHALGWDELLYVGTIALSYGASQLLKVSAFLAVFVAGTALFHQARSQRALPADASQTSTGLSQRLVAFGARLERLVEVSMVLFIGVAMHWVQWRWELLAFAAALLFVARPLAVLAVVRAKSMPAHQRHLIAWLGIRGVGSLFYLSYALAHGVEGALASEVISAVLACVAASIVLHGISSTPLMVWYRGRRGRRGP